MKIGIDGGIGRWLPWRAHRRSVDLVQVREELAQRGVPVNHLTDPDLEKLIQDGREALATAHVRGSDTTGAFVVVVRQQENF